MASDWLKIGIVEGDELDKDNISAAGGKQDEEWKVELSCATLRLKSNTLNISISGVSSQILMLFEHLSWPNGTA